MNDNKLTIFSCGNGDSILLQAHGKTILTDINLRETSENEEDNEAPPFADDIQEACTTDHLDLFVLTHPDQDHLRGFGEVFHLGDPGKWDASKDGTVLVDEIWCSSYSVDAKSTSEESKPVLKEIRRRHKLKGTIAGGTDGNRLEIRKMGGTESGDFGPNIDWRLLAPTDDESDISDPEASSNGSSLVIRWMVYVEGVANRVLLAGDSTVDVWDRIHDEVLTTTPEHLGWSVLVAPHHCSRHSLGRDFDPEHDEEFKESVKAVRALGQKLGDGYVVSSSLKFKAGVSPPSSYARNRYYRILAGRNQITEEAKDRFLVTGGKSGKKPAHVVFYFTKDGPARQPKPKQSAVTAGTVTGGGFGKI